MGVALDFSGDYLLWNNPEVVTLTGVRAPGRGGDTVTSVLTALQGQPDQKERAPTAGVYTGTDLLWLLPGLLLGSVVPKPADTVTDTGGTVWTILHADYDRLDQIYACYAVNLKLAHDLVDLCTLWKPKSSQDAAGSRTATHTQDGGERDCRFQLVAERTLDGRGKKLWRREYRVYLVEDVGRVTHEWQLRDASGTIYEPTGFENRQRIDELSVVLCQLEGD